MLLIFMSLFRYRRRLERERYHTTAIDYNTLNNISNMSTNTGSGTAPGGNKLAQEINDEFLTCKICLEGYKSPKSLDCLHTFCENCIESHINSECTYKKYSDYREFTCPLCRKRTQLPIGGVKKLPDNFLVSGLGEIVARQKPSKFPFCDICKLVNRKHREASSKCLDCNKLLCKTCVELHKETKVTKNHSIFDVDIEKDIECKEHSDEVVRFYCEPCEACICVLCTFNEHKDHEITQFSDAVVKYKETIQNLLDNCKKKIVTYDNQLTSLTACEGVIKTAEQKIRDTAIQMIADIRAKEKQFIDELHNVYGTEIMEYVNKRADLQLNVDSLKSTCSLTELVLQGKDIELLLLKKQVQEKLSCLSDIEINDIPDSVSSEFVFIPGCVDMGYLEDPKNPQPKQSKLRQPVTINSYHQQLQQQQQINAQNKPKTAPMKPATTQTEVNGSSCNSNPQMTHEYIQTEEYGSSINNVDSKYTETENVETLEKGVNTRSRSLQSLTSQLSRTQSEDVTGTDPTNPDVTGQEQRRHRRRRERQRLEASSSRPTANSTMLVMPNVRGGPILSYSSSIDEPFYTPDSNTAPD